MNPFAIQAEFARQWMNVAGAVTKAAFEGFAAVGQGSAAAAAGSSATPSFTPAALFAPWLAFWPKPPAPTFPMPFGAFASATPSPMPMLPMMLPWMQVWAPPQASAPAPYAGGVMLPWMMPLGVMMASVAPLRQALGLRNPGTDLIDQMAANYRSSSGYAVAAVIAPMPASMDARTFAAPWLQFFTAPRTLN
ncbi:MAG: hypothetical protein JSS20_02910 [Proteobacteria bacterium]|nr:hypothetical protein [Pseudomonadota bacterium]